jgi:hypothetical protein
MIGVRRRGLRLGVIGVLSIALAIGVTDALAATNPVKGAIYEPPTGATRPFVSFIVSASGKSMSKIQVSTAFVPCASLAAGDGFAFPSHATISGGRFTLHAIGYLNLSRFGVGAPSPLFEKDAATLTGTFLANGSVRGTYHAIGHCLGPPLFRFNGTYRAYSGPFSVTARPSGPHSVWCTDRKLGKAAVTEVAADAVTCEAVQQALVASNWAHDSISKTFTTPGWTCRNPVYLATCSKSAGQKFGFFSYGPPTPPP